MSNIQAVQSLGGMGKERERFYEKSAVVPALPRWLTAFRVVRREGG